MSDRKRLSMATSRRSLLLGGLSLPAVAAIGAPSFANPLRKPLSRPLANPLMITITGIDKTTPPSRLAGIYEPFLAQGLTVAFSVSPGASDEETGLIGTPIAQALRSLADAKPDQVEICLHIDDVSEQPYFQLREASLAQARFTRALNPIWDYRSLPLLTAMTATIASTPRSQRDLAAFRAAGLRTVVHLASGESADALDLSGYWMTSTGLAKTFGHRQTSLANTTGANGLASPDSIIQGIRQRAGEDGPIVVDIHVGRLDGLSAEDASHYCRDVAAGIVREREDARIRCVLPHVLYMQSRQGAQRYVAVRVDDYRIDWSKDEQHRRFVDRLLAAGVPLTEGVVPLVDGPNGKVPLDADEAAVSRLSKLLENPNYEIATHGLEHSLNELNGLDRTEKRAVVGEGIRLIENAVDIYPMSYIPPYNLYGGRTQGLADCGVKILSAQHNDYSRIGGLDENGVFHASNTVNLEKDWSGDVTYFDRSEILEHFGTRNDAVFMIHPGTFTTPDKATAVIDTLQALTDMPGTQLVNLAQYYDAMVPPMPALDLVQKARMRRVVAVPAQPDEAAAKSEEAVLRDDAAKAWEYFDRFAGRFGGLAPATALENARGEIIGNYPYVTMWDTASALNAHISAHRLGLIEERRFEDAIGATLAFLRQSPFVHQGKRLPVAIRALKGRRVTKRGFDATDTGRLLIALRLLDAYTSEAFPVADLVRSWDLGSTIFDDEIHDFNSDGLARTRHDINYAQYAAQGYGLWGFETRPVYREPEIDRDMDATMRFLGEVASLGPIATEPTITEEIELGASVESRLIADILLEAQIARHRRTGNLTCVSEMPINRRPWFTYQGYQLDDDGGHWTVHSPFDHSKFETPAFIEENRAVSTKGCFLWMAARPGDYSRQLHAYARSNGKTRGLGFASAIYEKTGNNGSQADINTNGLILESVAYVLNDRKPLIDLMRQT